MKRSYVLFPLVVLSILSVVSAGCSKSGDDTSPPAANGSSGYNAGASKPAGAHAAGKIKPPSAQ